MRMTPVNMTFRDHEWETIMDALRNEAENLRLDGEVSLASKYRRIAEEISERISD